VTAEHNVRAWTLGIARHTCLDEIRRRQRRRKLQKDYEGTRPVLVSADDSSLDLRELIAHIDADRRDAFVLTQLVGLSYEEVAEMCECPIGTVRSRVARARLDLRTLMNASHEAGTFPPPQATEKYGN
ncbi:MAG: RNA polymerase sigma factor, partial [Actinobacteria bacterium]|nr:RNA polymerase sigma factor [Actinomycetota bacterium]